MRPLRFLLKAIQEVRCSSGPRAAGRFSGTFPGFLYTECPQLPSAELNLFGCRNKGGTPDLQMARMCCLSLDVVKA